MSVIFDQLRISDDKKRMYINLHVNTAVYFDNVYLDSITIVTGDKVSKSNPTAPTADYIYHKEFEGNQKAVDMVLDVFDFVKIWEEDPHAMKFTRDDMSRTLFFVYVKCKGAPDPCTPCHLDEEVTLGLTFYEKGFYQRVMQYVKSLEADCEIPVGFADFILLWNAFKASIETGHYVPAIKFFDMLHDKSQGGPTYSTKNCGCHG